MTVINDFIKRHPAATYFFLAFAISWAGVLIVIVPSGIPATTEQANELFPFAYLAMLAGPTVAGILMTGLVHGRAGYRELWFRMSKWRIGGPWYAVAFLTAPIAIAGVLLPLARLFPEFLPRILATDDRASLLWFGIGVGAGAGFFEELGWTGFAVPQLARRYRLLGTGLIAGFLWGAWHFLVTYWGSGTSTGALSLGILLPGLLSAVAVLPAFRVLMVWVYHRTGSLLVTMLMHLSLTASTLIFQPVTSGMSLVIYGGILAAALWVFVAFVVASDKKGSRQPLPKPAS